MRLAPVRIVFVIHALVVVKPTVPKAMRVVVAGVGDAIGFDGDALVLIR
jgi:hypothetical protein